MSTLRSFLHAILTHTGSQQQLDEAYLAQSVDTCDLERRMRDLESRDRDPGLFLAHARISTPVEWRSLS